MKGRTVYAGIPTPSPTPKLPRESFWKRHSKLLAGGGAGMVVLLGTFALVASGVVAPSTATGVGQANGSYHLDVLGSVAPHMGRNIALILDGEDPNETSSSSSSETADSKNDAKDGTAKDSANKTKDDAGKDSKSKQGTSLLDIIEQGQNANGGEATGALEDAGEFVSDGEGGYVWQPHAGASNGSGSAGSGGSSGSGVSGPSAATSGLSGTGGSGNSGSSGGTWAAPSGGGQSSGGSTPAPTPSPGGSTAAPSSGGNAHSGNGNSGSSGSSSSASQQRWVEATYKTIDHPEEGHYETYTEYETVTVQKVICGGTDHNPGDPNYCGESPVWDDYSGWKAHQEAFLAEMRKTDPYYQCTGRHRPARYINVEEQRPVEKQRWVVDRAAWSEQVVDVPGHWE